MDELESILRKYGTKEGRDKYEYVFDDWDAPTIRIMLHSRVEYLPVYSVIYELHEMRVVYGDIDSGDLAEADISSVLDIEEVKELIIKENN